MFDFDINEKYPDKKDRVCKRCKEGIAEEASDRTEEVGAKKNDLKIIEQLDRETGGVIDTWESIKLAAAGLKKGHAIIGKALRGKSKSAHGFHWRYKQE